jgi:predicted negative regulator of RcsB-dependent stress response
MRIGIELSGREASFVDSHITAYSNCVESIADAVVGTIREFLQGPDRKKSDDEIFAFDRPVDAEIDGVKFETLGGLVSYIVIQTVNFNFGTDKEQFTLKELAEFGTRPLWQALDMMEMDCDLKAFLVFDVLRDIFRSEGDRKKIEVVDLQSWFSGHVAVKAGDFAVDDGINVVPWQDYIGKKGKFMSAHYYGQDFDKMQSITYQTMGTRAESVAKDNAMALWCYEQAIKANSSSGSAWFSLADYYEDAGNAPKALEAYSMAAGLAPGNYIVLERMADLQMASGNYNDAISSYSLAIGARTAFLGTSEAPDIGLYYEEIGNCHFKLGNYAEAVQNYEKSLGMVIGTYDELHNMGHKLHTSLFSSMAECYEKLGMPQKAEEYRGKDLLYCGEK